LIFLALFIENRKSLKLVVSVEHYNETIT